MEIEVSVGFSFIAPSLPLLPVNYQNVRFHPYSISYPRLRPAANSKSSLHSTEPPRCSKCIPQFSSGRISISCTSPMPPKEKNIKVADITKGLRAAMKIDHNKPIFDTTLCATYSELAITNSKAPYVVGTQVHLDSSSGVVLVDTIATTTRGLAI
jgi:hypothetical protein